MDAIDVAFSEDFCVCGHLVGAHKFLDYCVDNLCYGCFAENYSIPRRHHMLRLDNLKFLEKKYKEREVNIHGG